MNLELVTIQLVFSEKLHIAARKVTGKDPGSHVSSHMVISVARVVKCLIAARVGAFVWSLTIMGTKMDSKVSSITINSLASFSSNWIYIGAFINLFGGTFTNFDKFILIHRLGFC